MTFEVRLPGMGDTVEEAEILAWAHAEGDSVGADETLLEVGTDKVDTEVPSPVSGTLVRILAQPGEVVAVGTVIAEIDEG